MAQESVVLFKHSSACAVSSMAKREVASYKNAQPEAAVFMVVVQRRDLAEYISQVTGVPHASPQVIVLRGGELIGALSHYEITVESMSELIDDHRKL